MNEATRKYVFLHRNDNTFSLALNPKSVPEGVDFINALTQIKARQKLAEKVPSWLAFDDLEFPDDVSVEICSSESTARYKASLLSGSTFADLTGGLGVDTYFIAKNFNKSTYVERNELLCNLAKNNFNALHSDIEVNHNEAEHFIENCSHFDALFLDPLRRDANAQKVVLIEQCSPNVIALQNTLLERANTVLIKLSPMLDLSLALQSLQHVKQAHVLAINNECKELLFLLQHDFEGETEIHCVNIYHHSEYQSFVSTIQQERQCVMRLASHLKHYLYEPNVTLLKAGFFKSVTSFYNLEKLHISSHLYTSDQFIPDFAGKIFEIIDAAPYNKKIRKGLLTDIHKANLSVRNFPLRVDELRKTLHLDDGDEYSLFATTLAPDNKVIIKTKRLFPTI